MVGIVSDYPILHKITTHVIDTAYMVEGRKTAHGLKSAACDVYVDFRYTNPLHKWFLITTVINGTMYMYRAIITDDGTYQLEDVYDRSITNMDCAVRLRYIMEVGVNSAKHKEYRYSQRYNGYRLQRRLTVGYDGSIGYKPH